MIAPTQDDLAKILQLVPPIAWDVTVPILVEHEGMLKQHGTGTLLRVAQECFLVTASHVTRDAFSVDAGLFLTANAAGERFVQARGTWHMTAASPSRGRDVFDIAVLHLAPETVRALAGRTFVNLNDVWKKFPIDDDIFVICGFPGAMSVAASPESPKLTLAPLKLVTSLYDGPTVMMDGKSPKFENYEPEYHFLLNANKQNIRAMEGIDTTFPDDLRGISGCSVWKMNVKSYPRDKWSSEKARIVGVQNCVHGSRVVRATHWAAVNTLLSQTFPDLRPSLGLWRPN